MTQSPEAWQVPKLFWSYVSKVLKQLFDKFTCKKSRFLHQRILQILLRFLHHRMTDMLSTNVSIAKCRLIPTQWHDRYVSYRYVSYYSMFRLNAILSALQSRVHETVIGNTTRELPDRLVREAVVVVRPPILRHEFLPAEGKSIGERGRESIGERGRTKSFDENKLKLVKTNSSWEKRKTSF